MEIKFDLNEEAGSIGEFGLLIEHLNDAFDKAVFLLEGATDPEIRCELAAKLRMLERVKRGVWKSFSKCTWDEIIKRRRAEILRGNNR